MNLRTFCVGAVLVLLGCQAEPPSEPVEAAEVDPVERGEYLVTVLACGYNAADERRGQPCRGGTPSAQGETASYLQLC
jgi:hypothetical protein